MSKRQPKPYGEQLAKIMEKHGLNQLALGDELFDISGGCVRQPNINVWLHGKANPRWNAACYLSDYFQTPLQWFYNGDTTVKWEPLMSCDWEGSQLKFLVANSTARGMTSSDIANALGQSLSSLNAQMRGASSPKWEVLCRMSELFETPIDSFRVPIEEEFLDGN